MPSVDEGERVGARHLLFDEDLFRNTVTRERKRTERSGLAMVMLLVGVQDGRRLNAPSVLEGVTKAFSAVKSEIDILGWYEQHSVMGLIVPEVDSASLTATAEGLEGEFRREIASRIEENLAERLSITLRVYPELYCLGDEEHQMVDPFLYPELQLQQARRTHFHVVKRGMDILVSFLLLIILSPLLLAIAGFVKLSSRGPVLFRQVRIGQMMKPFMFFKFRTMYADSDHAIHQAYVSWFISSSGKAQEKEKHTFFKMTNDSRVTPIGHFLRKPASMSYLNCGMCSGETCRWSVHDPHCGMSCDSTSRGIVAEFWKPSRALRAVAGDRPESDDVRRNGQAGPSLCQGAITLGRHQNSARDSSRSD